MSNLETLDLEAYLDSLPEPELPSPVCGMCRYFVPARQLSFCGDRPVLTPSHCSLRAIADLPSRFEFSDSNAEQCPFFEEAIPF